MRRLLMVFLVGAVLVSGYMYARHTWKAVEAFNRSNLYPYESVAGLQIEAKT